MGSRWSFHRAEGKGTFFLFSSFEENFSTQQLLFGDPENCFRAGKQILKKGCNEILLQTDAYVAYNPDGAGVQEYKKPVCEHA